MSRRGNGRGRRKRLREILKGEAPPREALEEALRLGMTRALAHPALPQELLRRFPHVALKGLPPSTPRERLEFLLSFWLERDPVALARSPLGRQHLPFLKEHLLRTGDERLAMGLVPLLNEQEREALARHPAEGVRLALAEQGFPVPEILLQDPSPRVRLAAMRHLNPLAYALLTRPEMRRCLEAWAEQAESLAPRFPSPWPLEFSWETLPWSPEGAQALVLLSRWAKLPGLEGWARQALYDLKGALLRRWLQEGRVEPVALLRGEDPRKRVDEGWVSGLAAPLAVDYLEDALAALLEDPEGEGEGCEEAQGPCLGAAWVWRAAGSPVPLEGLRGTHLVPGVWRALEFWNEEGLGPLGILLEPEEFPSGDGLPRRRFRWSFEELTKDRPALLRRFHPQGGDLVVLRVEGAEVELHAPYLTLAHLLPTSLPQAPREEAYGRPPTESEREAWPVERLLPLLTPEPPSEYQEVVLEVRRALEEGPRTRGGPLGFWNSWGEEQEEDWEEDREEDWEED